MVCRVKHKNLIPEQVWHGPAHWRAMLVYADQIILDYAKDNFKERDLFLLLAGISLHDMGVHCLLLPRALKP
ncbi:MAG: hypothetical protein NDI81_08675 [Desulfobacula sp.]|nr:hypothetical protein [Desulfobacula sp.]